MTLSLNAYDRLVSSISAASLDPTMWQNVLDGISDMISGVRTHMFGYDALIRHTFDPISAGYDPEHIRDFTTRFADQNAWAPGFSQGNEGQVMSSRLMISDEELHKTAFYHEWVRPHEDICRGGGAVLSKRDDHFFAIGGNIPLRHGALEKPFLALLARLTPHIRAAIGVNVAMAGLRLENIALSRGCVRGRAGLLLVSADRRVLFANAEAQAMLSDGGVIGTDPRLRLRLRDGTGDRILNRALARLSGAGFSSAMAEFRLGVRMTCRFAPLGAEDRAALRGLWCFGDEVPCLLVSLCENDHSAPTRQGLQQAYAMSKAEADVTLRLSLGQSLREIAEARGTSLHTVRHQVKAAMVKAQVHTQRDLALRAIRIAGTQTG